jgi:hypothetical protein
MPDYRSFDCSEGEITQLEVSLKKDGYLPTTKSNQKDLLPMEYFKRLYSGTATAFEGPKRWAVTCQTK